MRSRSFPSGIPARLAVLVVAATPVGLATAQEPAPTAWELRAVDGMPTRLQVELATQGKPTWFTAEASDVTLRQAISQTCGTQTATVEKALHAEALRLNGLESLDEPVEMGMTLAVPFCLRLERNVEVEVQPGDTVEALLQKHYGVFGQRTLEKTAELNRRAIGSRNRERFFRNLSVGQTILLPYEATPRTFAGRTEDTDLSQLVQELADPQIAAAIETSATPAGDDPEPDPGSFSLVESVDIASADGRPPCTPAEDMDQPIDMRALKAVFDEEQRLMAARGDAMTTTHVGIIDTGLQKPGDDFFSIEVMVVNTSELHGEAGQDNDIPPNGARHDIFGINLNNAPPTGNVLPYGAPTASWRFHGTRMASLLLGGPNVVEDWGAARPPIKLRIVNFASSLANGLMVDAIHLNTAIEYLRKYGVSVVNISLSNQLNITGVKNSIERQEGMLFVVAAGNKHRGQGEDLAFSPLYPAKYGGRHGANVLTVAAHGRSGAKAPFSYFSGEFVDLLAPGCGIETRNGDGNTMRDSGTSPAAALVSFAASLLKSAGLSDPAAIKMRILAAVDPDETLGEYTWSKGRLNAVKALSLRRDVIQTADGALHYGILADRSPLIELCSNSGVDAPGARKVYKVRPNVETPNGVRVEYWIYSDGRLNPWRCAQNADTGASIALGTSQIPLSEIRDVVFKWR